MPDERHSHEADAHRTNHRPHDRQVVLEIGGDLGALIVYTDPALLHSEIEISPAGDDGGRSHKDVLERVVGGRSFYAAVFDRVPQGTYTLWHAGAPFSRGVRVGGGRITEVEWRPRAALA